MSDAVTLQSVFQGAGDVLLADQLREELWPVATGQDGVSFGRRHLCGDGGGLLSAMVLGSQFDFRF